MERTQGTGDEAGARLFRTPGLGGAVRLGRVRAALRAHQDKLADLNVLCVLKEITPQELSDGEPVLRWWRGNGPSRRRC